MRDDEEGKGQRGKEKTERSALINRIIIRN